MSRTLPAAGSRPSGAWSGARGLSRVAAGVLGGAAAGLVMGLALMGYHALRGESVWTNPNLIAVMWLGREAAGGQLSAATLVGFLTHMVTSVLMGWIAVPFIRDLPPWRTLLLAVAYSLASYPVVFAVVLTWANPLMVARTHLVPMTAGHTLFGLVLGTVYLWLQLNSPAAPPEAG